MHGLPCCAAAKLSGLQQPSLSKDLAKFVKGLNFSAVRPSAVEDPEEADNDVSSAVETEIEDEDEDEQAETSTSMTAAVKVAPSQSKPEEKQSVTIPKVGSNTKLVSFLLK